MPHADAMRLLEYEAKALLERVSEIRPFALTLPMVAAAAPSVAAQAAIESLLSNGRNELRRLIQRFLAWLGSPDGVRSSPAEAQQRFTTVRLRFLSTITQFDTFADILAERSQHAYGELLAGLDVAAADALELPGRLFDPPPILCHLDRGPGAAIRRARTRLPGGGVSPVAIVRVPRERMVGSAIASSLFHEVGHQGAELLNLVEPMRQVLLGVARRGGQASPAWNCLARWISEILADFWSIARLGIGSTTGLMGVVSLPKAFVTRASLDGPHPTPWIRVKISAALGRGLYPDPQWDRVASLWEEFYPLRETRPQDAALFRLIESVLPRFVAIVLGYRGDRLGGAALAEVFPREDRAPSELRRVWQAQRRSRSALAKISPSLAFAVVGQARHDAAIGPEAEAALLRRLLRYWALKSTIDASEVCSSVRKPRGLALAV